MARAILKESIKKNAKKQMQKIGVYKPEFDDVLDIYSELLEQYRRLTVIYKKSGYAVTAKTNSGDVKKSPIVSELENLRKDILQYSDRLCLNPKIYFKTDAEKEAPKSALAEALRSLEG